MKIPDTWKSKYLENAIAKTQRALDEEKTREQSVVERSVPDPAETRILAMSQKRSEQLERRLRRYRKLLPKEG